MAILVVSIPAGAITRWIGARRLTLIAGAAMAFGDLAIGLAPGYAWLLIGRGVFGFGLGILWVGSTAWLHDAAGEHRMRALSMTSAVIGLGSLVGPAFAGVIGERAGIGAPFLLLAGATVAVFVALVVGSPNAPGTARRDDEPAFVDMVRAAGGDDMVRGSVALMLVASLLWLTSYLLVPFRLDAEGWSSGDIGLAFSVSSLLYAGVSVVVARRAERLATLGVAAAATGALAASLAVVVASSSVAATLTFLMLAGVTTAVMISLTFPIGVAGPGHISVALVGGLLNVAWALSGLLGPTLGGVAAEVIGDRPTFLLLSVIAVAAAAWMVRARARAGAAARAA
jgi:predicted MFS family arabinose efflux permease